MAGGSHTHVQLHVLPQPICFCMERLFQLPQWRFIPGICSCRDDRRLQEITENYRRLQETTGDYWRLQEITGNYRRLLGKRKLLETTGNYILAGDCWRLLEITGDYWRLLEITGDYWRPQAFMILTIPPHLTNELRVPDLAKREREHPVTLTVHRRPWPPSRIQIPTHPPQESV